MKRQELSLQNSHMLSRVTCGLPCYLGEKQRIKTKIHSTIMSISQWCKGLYCFWVSCSKINKSIGWDLPNQMILKSSLLFMHKILSKHQHGQIADKIRLPRSRASANMCLKYQNKSTEFSRTTLYQGVKLYNSLPKDLKNIDCRTFKLKIKKIYFRPP